MLSPEIQYKYILEALEKGHFAQAFHRLMRNGNILRLEAHVGKDELSRLTKEVTTGYYKMSGE